MRLIVAISFVLLAGLACSQAKPPIKVNTPAVKNDGTSKGDRTKKPQTPTIMRGQVSPAIHSDSGEKHPGQDKPESTDERVARFTLYLVIVGSIQFLAMIAQAFYMFRTLKLTKQAADDSIQVNHQAQRAYISISNIGFAAGELQQNMSRSPGYGIFTVKNTGSTPAFRLNIKTGTYPNASLPEQAAYQNESYRSWLPVGAEMLIVAAPRPVSGAQGLLQYTVGNTRLYISIEYTDVYRVSHATRTIAVYNAGVLGMAFVQESSTEAYDYAD